jgi:hypothetical protein
MQVQKFQEQGILLPVNHDFKIEVKSSFEQKDNVLNLESNIHDITANLESAKIRKTLQLILKTFRIIQRIV